MSERIRGAVAGVLAGAARRGARWAGLAAVLGLVAVVVPDSGTRDPSAELVSVQQASGVSLAATDQDVVWILAVGSDARPGEDMTRSRGDALHLIGIDLRTHAATDIGVPRDSFVNIPGHGYDKINSSLYFGGPSLLATTVGNLVGVRPDYVFVTRFPYFIDMVNTIGKITVHNPRFFADDPLKPTGFKKGAITLGGYDAMAFSRARHELPRGDFDRSANQSRVIRGIQARIHSHAWRPGFVAKGVAAVMRDTQTNLSPSTLFQLAWAVAQVDPRKVSGCVVQGSIGTTSYGASIVNPYVSQARSYGDQARHDATIEHC